MCITIKKTTANILTTIKTDAVILFEVLKIVQTTKNKFCFFVKDSVNKHCFWFAKIFIRDLARTKIIFKL